MSIQLACSLDSPFHTLTETLSFTQSFSGRREGRKEGRKVRNRVSESGCVRGDGGLIPLQTSTWHKFDYKPMNYTYSYGSCALFISQTGTTLFDSQGDQPRPRPPKETDMEQRGTTSRVIHLRAISLSQSILRIWGNVNAVHKNTAKMDRLSAHTHTHTT